MAATWRNYFLLPLAIGGAGMLVGEALPEPSKQVTEIRVFVGPVAAISEIDPNPSLQRITIPPSGRITFFDAPQAANQTATWFVNQSPSGWEAGPVIVGVDLSADPLGDFDLGADFVCDRFRDAAATAQPVGVAKPMNVRRAYPRDNHAWPSLSVLLDSATPAGNSIGDTEQAGGPLVGDLLTKGRLYQISISAVAWTGTPEDRSLIALWMGRQAERLMESMKYGGFMEPAWTLQEDENFQELNGVPVFLARMGITATVHAESEGQVRTGFGRVTV